MCLFHTKINRYIGLCALEINLLMYKAHQVCSWEDAFMIGMLLLVTHQSANTIAYLDLHNNFPKKPLFHELAILLSRQIFAVFWPNHRCFAPSKNMPMEISPYII